MEPGLPYPCEVGADGALMEASDGATCDPHEPGARLLPRLRWLAVKRQLLDCLAYRGLCRDALGESDRVWRVVTRASLAAQAARLSVDQIQAVQAESTDWPAWRAYVWIVAVGIGLFFVGAGAGAIVALVSG
jgi:hypothetical protein